MKQNASERISRRIEEPWRPSSWCRIQKTAGFPAGVLLSDGWEVGKGEFLVRVKKGGVVGWKGAARSYTAEALEGKKRVNRDGGGVT